MKINLPVSGNERSYDTSERIISTTDPKGIITGYNETFFEISGFSAEELDGKNHNVVRHPDMPPAAFADLWDTVKQNKSWMGIVKNRCKNGDHYWVDAFVTPITENGEIVEYQSVRHKPDAERVARADAVYRRLNDNKKPFHRQLPLLAKLSLAFLVGLTPLLLAALSAPQWIWPATLLSLALGVGLSAWIMRPLLQLCRDSRKLVNNPLMAHIYTGRSDEIGQLKLSHKMLHSQLDAVVSRLAFSTEQLSRAAHDSSSVAQQANDCIRQQQQAVSEIGTAITQMSHSITEVAQNAHHTAQATRAADDESHKGRDTLHETVGAFDALSQSIGSGADVVKRLNEESKAIETVLDVIRGIAEQTNLLALNAAIEAARAGESGRGFAVVADEVRSLAQRTQESIEEIETMITRLQESATEVSANMEGCSSKTEKCSTQAHAIAEFLALITDSVTNIATMTEQIAQAADEQSTVTEQIKENVEQLTGQADKSVHIAHENDQISRDLTSLTAQLKKLAHQFQ